MSTKLDRTHVIDLTQKVGQTVKISGFVHAVRDQGNIKFINVRDVTALVQLVVLKNHQDAFNLVKDLTLESVVTVIGLVKDAKQAVNGIEIEAESIEILSKADAMLPIPVVTEKSGDETNQNARYDHRWIDLRKENNLQIFKVWTALEKGFRSHVNSSGYVQIYTPSFINAPSESGAEVFTVDYFDRKVFLAQSPQFYKQMAMASGLEKVFCVGPVFRAEPSYTTRHMTEFTGWDAEISYIKDHHDVMDEEEKFIIAGFMELKNSVLPDIVVPTSPFPRIKMVDAKQILKEKGITSEHEHDMSPEEERAISAYIKEKYDHDFVFLIDWHISKRPFYHMRHEENKELTKSFDLLYKGLEITTGAQREHRHEVLLAQAKEKEMDLEKLKFYTDFFKYGCPPHGGIGIGPARIIMQILGLASVKDAAYLPRDVKRITP